MNFEIKEVVAHPHTHFEEKKKPPCIICYRKHSMSMSSSLPGYENRNKSGSRRFVS